MIIGRVFAFVAIYVSANSEIGWLRASLEHCNCPRVVPRVVDQAKMVAVSAKSGFYAPKRLASWLGA